MTALPHTAALICVVAGLGAGATVGIAARDGRLALQVALDFWLAAGLLNLTGAYDWSSLAVTALVVAVRQTATLGLRHAAGPADPDPGGTS